MNLLTDKNLISQFRIGPSLFTLSPEQGARLLSWDVVLSKSIRHVLYSSDIQNPHSNQPIVGGNQVLFPFTGISAHKETPNTWKHPNGQILFMPYNGFVRNANYKIVYRDKSSLSLQLIPSIEMQENYPFNYKFVVHYKFHELSFEITLELENLDSTPLPWSAGIAFDIFVPWHPELSLKNYHLRIPAKKAFHQEALGKLISIKEFEENTHLDDLSLINRIHSKLKSNSLTLGPNNEEENITVKMVRDIKKTSHTTVKTWKNTLHPFFRIETNMGLPNAIVRKKGLNSILPTNKESFSISVNLL